MKNLLHHTSLIFIAVAFIILPTASALAQAPQPTPSIQAGDLQTAASRLIELLADGQFAQATENFNSKMKEAAPPEKMAEIWQGLIQQLGAFQRQTDVQLTPQEGYNIVYVTGQFEKGTLDFKVVFDQQGQRGKAYPDYVLDVRRRAPVVRHAPAPATLISHSVYAQASI